MYCIYMSTYIIIIGIVEIIAIVLLSLETKQVRNLNYLMVISTIITTTSTITTIINTAVTTTITTASASLVKAVSNRFTSHKTMQQLQQYIEVLLSKTVCSDAWPLTLTNDLANGQVKPVPSITPPHSQIFAPILPLSDATAQ